MWQQLEASYNIDMINKLEDELKDKSKKVDKLKGDVEAMERISKEQTAALESMGGKNKENSEKLYQLNLQVREAKNEAKQLRDQCRDDQKFMQVQHEQIRILEEKVKKITNLIKEQKNHKNNATQRTIANPMSVTDDTKVKLEEELKLLEESRLTSEKRYKNQLGKLEGQLKQLGHELQILGIKLKEKDQEVKLNDLKIKELRKQVPNTKLRPLALGNADTLSVGSRKNNLSVDSKINNNFDQESIVSE